jgi:serine/threonine-protein kinase
MRKADRILSEALGRADAERDAFIRDACGTDADLVDLVLRLLRDAERDDDGLATGAILREALDGQWLDEKLDDDAVGRTIGPYRLLQPLGRGGSATVYLAERIDGEFEQRVAVKVLRAEAALADGVVRRFTQERQILAGLRHPGIASLLDGGTTPWGRPFLVVELIEGRPLDVDCKERGLDVRERVRRIIDVADALQYAHRHLVVHRDLKPSNILVAAEGRVKLLDFGIAKLLDPNPSAGVAATGTLAMWMTPRYASPEQILGLPVTTASDLYQLGLVLYELLTGQPAFDAPTDSPAALVASARDRSSARPATVAQVPDELDAIVQMATHGDPSRRYDSVAAFAEDLRAFLDRRPVRARGDSLVYRLKVFARRHRAGVAFAAAAIVAVLGFSAAMTWSYLRAERARERAEAIGSFLESTLQGAQPHISRGRDTELLEAILADAAERIEGELGDRPYVAADVHRIVSETYRLLSDFDRAQQHAELSLRAFASELGPKARETIKARQLLGLILWDQSHYEQAEGELREVLALAQRELGPSDPVTIWATSNLGLAIRAQGRPDEALPYYREALGLARTSLGNEAQDTIGMIGNLAFLLAELDRLDEAEPLAREAADLSRRHLGPDNPDTYLAIDKLAALVAQRDRLAEALPLHQEALQGMRRLLGDRHSTTLGSIYSTAIVLRRLGRADEAIASLREVEAVVREDYGRESRFLFPTLLELGRAYLASGRPAEALPCLEEAHELATRVVSSEHYLTALIAIHLADARIESGRPDGAPELVGEARRVLESTFGEDGTHRYFADLVRVEGKLASP